MSEKKQVLYDLRITYSGPFLVEDFYREVDAWIGEKGFEKDVHILMQVHDEIVLEVREGLVEKISPDIKKIMEEIIPPKDISGIVCVADAKVGDNWGEMDKS